MREFENAVSPSDSKAFRNIAAHQCVFQIQPDLRELMETMNRMSNMPPDSEAKDKVNLW